MIAQAVGSALLHSLWQAALCAAVLFVVLRLVNSPRVRYAAGLAVLASMLAAFTMTAFRPAPFPTSGAAPASRILLSPATPSIPSSSSAERAAPGAYEQLTWIWLAGVCLCHLWQLTGYIGVRRLRHRAAWPASDAWRTRLDQLRARVGVAQPVLLLESLLVRTPVVLGHLKPAILVPAGLLTGLAQPQVEALLLHELAHIRRYDYLVNVVQRWIEALFFYHPAVWWISSVVRSEREKCCDDVAAALSGDVRGYVGALLALEQQRAQQPALAANGSGLTARVQRLLGRPQPASGLPVFLVLFGAAAVAVAGWQTGTPPGALEPEAKRVREELVTPRERPAIAAIRTGQQFQAVVATPAPEPYAKWLREDVAYIVTPAERAGFARLRTDQQFQAFIAEFWRRRGAAAKEEHYRRIAYANDRFPEDRPGWTTDRGRIYITHGPPAEIESHPQSDPAYEVWRYRDLTPFVFVADGQPRAYRLTGSFVPNRKMRWSVTDPQNRFVTGLQPEHFQATANGRPLPLANFTGPDDGTAIAVVSDALLPDLPPDVYQSRTPEDALRLLQQVAGARKVLLIAATGRPIAFSFEGSIDMVHAEPGLVRKAVIELRNQYSAQVTALDSPASIDLAVKQPAGLPPLRVNPAP